MSCPCKGTWKEPCMECYGRALKRRIEERETVGETSQDLPIQLGKADVPASAIAALNGTLTETPEMVGARKFCANLGLLRYLVLLGPPGRGKTVAAAWALRHELKTNNWNNSTTFGATHPCLFVPASRLTRVSNFEAVDKQWVGELEKVRMLVLDDAGDEANAVGVQTLRDLLLHRERKARPTVVTSNLRAAAFGERYGQALMDRIRSVGELVESPGKSMRRLHVVA